MGDCCCSTVAWPIVLTSLDYSKESKWERRKRSKGVGSPYAVAQQ